MHRASHPPTFVVIAASAALGVLAAGSSQSTSASEMTLFKNPFGKTASGESVDLFTLANDTGVTVKITNYGGVITSIVTPDREGKPGDIVLGFDNLADYQERSPHFGCITGRFANRIAGGKFTLDGKEYTLAVNNGPNHLHGGKIGFDKIVWAASTGVDSHSARLALTHTSPDGDEGYPGKFTAKVTYTLTDKNELRIDYEATTDKPTVFNLTNHSYFNLEGHGSGDVLGHRLQLHATRFTPTDETAIPTGELRPVAGTALDFTTAKPIGRDIGSDEQQIVFGKGYDHNFVIDGNPGELRPVARVSAPKSGRVLTVTSTEPGVQLYTANFLGKTRAKDGAEYNHRGAFCLETQHFPDSPNHPEFPTTTLRPGEVFHSTTVFRFSND